MYVPLVGASSQLTGNNVSGAIVSDNGFSRSHPHSHLLMPQHSVQRLARNSLAVSGAVGSPNPGVPIGLSMQRRQTHQALSPDLPVTQTNEFLMVPSTLGEGQMLTSSDMQNIQALSSSHVMPEVHNGGVTRNSQTDLGLMQRQTQPTSE